MHWVRVFAMPSRFTTTTRRGDGFSDEEWRKTIPGMILRQTTKDFIAACEARSPDPLLTGMGSGYRRYGE